jgi:hypothetical protein
MTYAASLKIILQVAPDEHTEYSGRKSFCRLHLIHTEFFGEELLCRLHLIHTKFSGDGENAWL